MKLEVTQTIVTDVLVIGGGAAGLRAAIEARKHALNVLVVSLSPVGFRNNSAIAGGGFAASGLSRKSADSPDVHIEDTIFAGKLANDRKLVELMAGRAAQQVYDLIEFGVNFRKRGRALRLYHWVGHTYPRHVIGIKGGISLTRPMRDYAQRTGIQFIEGILVTGLLKTGDTVFGAVGIDYKGQIFVFKAKSTILATGGAGELYLRTDNALGSTGDGFSLAYSAGAILRDMEFVQFYPTALDEAGRKGWDYALVEKGAVIRNSKGENILAKYGINDYKLMTRDMVSRAVMIEIREGRGFGDAVSVDMAGLGSRRKSELKSDLMVAPTVHFFMGGVKINENSETGLDGLYAAGEVCGGAHGANRLAGNAITECLVFGAIAGDKASQRASKIKRLPDGTAEVAAETGRLNMLASLSGSEDANELERMLRQTMWRKVGIIRDEANLKSAGEDIIAFGKQLNILSPKDPRQLIQVVKLTNMLTVAEMVCKAALARTESRGAHYRVDYPEQDDMGWLRTIEISNRGGGIGINIVPLNIK